MYYDRDDYDDFYRQGPVTGFAPYAPVGPILPVPPPINAPYCVWRRYWKRYWQYYNWWRNNAIY